MSVVYEGRRKQDNAPVAIKIITPEFTQLGEKLEEIFDKGSEGEIAMSLRHPNVVRTLDYGHKGREYYIVMEYIDGITLSKLIRIRGGLSREECIYFITSIAKALEFAHNLNIVHRDVKPGNVMLTGPGFANINTSKKLTEDQIKQALKETTVKVLDFGLAKLKTGHSIPVSAVFSKPKVNMKLPTNLNDTMTQEVELSVSGSLIGTMVYSSPEQKSNPKHVDKRADIYSLGLLFYQILVGEVPKEVQIEKVPTAFRNLIQKAIEPDIKLRISSATEFLELLNEVLEEEQKFKDAQKGSADDCRRFMHMYPNSIFLSEIKQSLEYKVLEEAEYRKAVAGTTKDCESYLETFQGGRFTQQITDLLIHKQASEAIIFEMIKMFIISFVTGGLGGLVFTASTLGMLFGFILGFCIGIGLYWYRFRYRPKIRS